MNDDSWLRKNKIDILRYLPYKLQKDDKFYTVNTAESQEHENIRLIINDLLKQLFIDTATWGLDYFEEFLNIIPKKNDDYQTRRTRIKILLNTYDVSTVKFMTDLANKFISDNSAQIIEHNQEYWFEVFFNIDGLISLNNLRAAIELYKPAHLGFKIVFHILSKILISHKSSIIQHVNANHNFWNLGTTEKVYWDGNWILDNTINFSGTKPNALYKDRQTHLLDTNSLLMPKLEFNIAAYFKNKQQFNSKHKQRINYSNKTENRINNKQKFYRKYKVSNTNKANVIQNRTANTKNCWNGSFCLDGSHILSGAYEIDKQMENICLFYSVKNGLKQEQGEIL